MEKELMFECPKCQAKFNESQASSIEFDDKNLPADLKGMYCVNCFVRFIQKHVAKLKEV